VDVEFVLIIIQHRTHLVIRWLIIKSNLNLISSIRYRLNMGILVLCFVSIPDHSYLDLTVISQYNDGLQTDQPGFVSSHGKIFLFPTVFRPTLFITYPMDIGNDTPVDKPARV
jgi:hypothetical protein